MLNEEAIRYILPYAPSMVNAEVNAEKNITIDIAGIFGNENPLEIEIGFGTGKFLTTAAKEFPAINFLGIEVTGKMVNHVANQLLAGNISNARVVHADGRVYMRHCIAKESVSRVHVYFPDPWVKKRHRKRRIINVDFLSSVHSVLRNGGTLNFFTDHAEYFDYFNEHTALVSGFERSEIESFYTPTSYESKWVREGRTIYRAILKKL